MATKLTTPRLVPTTYSKPFRDTGRYDSTERLPDLDLLFDRTLRQMIHAHDFRERHPRSFESLWTKVCKHLLKKKNATGYAHWKTTEDIVKNKEEIKELDGRLAAAWMSVEVTCGQGDQMRVVYRNSDEFDALYQERKTLKPKIRVSTDDALEIAIAYWIEAKNARNEGDEIRALHALIECHLHIGITLSVKTESESKSEAGKKQGQRARDAIAKVAVEVLRNLKADKLMEDPDYLFGKVTQVIERTPKYATVLAAYDAQATAGKDVLRGSSTSDRFTATLQRWAISKNSPYREIGEQHRRILYQVDLLKSANAQRRKRQAHS